MTARLKRVTEELKSLQTVLEMCVGEGDTVADDAPGIVSDAVELLEELHKTLHEETTFCLWCARAGVPEPHRHESDDHPDVPEAQKVT